MQGIRRVGHRRINIEEVAATTVVAPLQVVVKELQGRFRRVLGAG